MALDERLRSLEEEVAQLEQVVRLSEAILAELMKASPPPVNLEQVRHFLRSAKDLLKHGEQETGQELVAKAEEALHSVRQWLAVGDLGVSPFLLRNHLEKNRLNGELQRALILYFLRKQPHAENDRDKLDYLLSAYFLAANLPPEKIPAAVAELFAELPPRELQPAGEMMLHELQSLIARIEDFTDFDQLVHARVVERARALKINLGEDFYDPDALPTIIRFNLAFRQHFEKLLNAQLTSVRRSIRQQIEEAWTVTRAIEAACEKLVLPKGARVGAALADEEEEDAAEPRIGRPLETLEERLPIDRLVRRGEDPQKESELNGIITRLARFVEKLPPDQTKAERVAFPLREAKLELATWEREAFVPAVAGAAPQSVRAIQYALGVIAWIEEELVRYQKTRGDRYLWKTHFDLLSYAVVRAGELLKKMRGIIREEAPDEEVDWLLPLLQTALRLATTLNHVAPVFAEPAAS